MKYFLSILILSSFLANALMAQNNNEKPYHENIIIFKIKPEYRNNFDKNIEFSNLLSKYNDAEIKREFPAVPKPLELLSKQNKKTVDLSLIYRIEFLNDIDLENFVKRLNSLKIIEYAELLYKQELLFVPNDTYATSSGSYNQYWLSKIKAFEAWDIHKGDTAMVIAISDTGIDFNHIDLIGNIKINYDTTDKAYPNNTMGWNFGDNNNNPQTTNSHGIQVSGIAGAVTNNGTGVAGAGFLCKIMPLKVSVGTTNTLVNTYQSIVYAADHGAKVINCSWGGPFYQQMAKDVIDYATYNRDVLIVAGAGNTNTEVEWYPASYENVLSVAGTNQNDQRWVSSSTYGSTYNYKVDISAPAVGFTTTTITTSTSDNTYVILNNGGTSYATPIVSGSAAILRSYYPDYSALQIAELLKISADVIDTIEYNKPYAAKMGTGRINLYNALTMEPVPSVVFKNYEIIYQENKLIINGDFINYLNNAENLTISANVMNYDISLEKNLIFSGNLNTLETYKSENEIIINISENVKDTIKILKFTYKADNYEATQYIRIFPKTYYNTVKTDILELSVFANGKLGYFDNVFKLFKIDNIENVNLIKDRDIGNGFTINNYMDLIGECGIISGNSATNVFCAPFKEESNFKTILETKLVENEKFDYHSIAEFDDSKGNSLGVKIKQNAYSKLGNENKNFIILEYNITNTSEKNIKNYYFGIFTDWDLLNNNYNTTVYDENNKFLYCQSDGSQNLYAGIKLLTQQNVNNYSLPVTAGGDGYVDIINNFTDINKFYLITNSNTDKLWQNKDVGIYTGAGPFDINVNDTINVAFAIIVSSDYSNFMEAINTAKQTYNKLYNDDDDVSVACSYTFSDIHIYPNPAKNLIYLSGEILKQNPIYEIYNVVGEKVINNKLINDKIDITKLSAGIYFLKIYTNEGIITRKFIKQ